MTNGYRGLAVGVGFAWVGVGATCAAFGGCAEHDRAPVDEYCSELCGAFDRCTRLFAFQTCVRECADDAFVDTASPGFLVELADCYRGTSCDDLEDTEVMNACIEEAVLAVEPSQACGEYCEAEVQATFECGGSWSVSDCLTTGVCSWSDDVLRQGASCYENEACEDLEACLDQIFSVE